jgi:hypothetical protein
MRVHIPKAPMLNEIEKRALEMLLAGEDDRLAILLYPSAPGSASLVETKERDLGWALRDAV